MEHRNHIAASPANSLKVLMYILAFAFGSSLLANSERHQKLCERKKARAKQPAACYFKQSASCVNVEPGRATALWRIKEQMSRINGCINAAKGKAQTHEGQQLIHHAIAVQKESENYIESAAHVNTITKKSLITANEAKNFRRSLKNLETKRKSIQ